MTLYKNLEKIFPYLSSVRKLENFISIDILFTRKWSIPKKFIDEKSVLETEQEDTNTRLLSFVTNFDNESIQVLIKNIEGIIDFNLEKEEKEKLFRDKVMELKTIFEGQSLDKLKSLVFDLESTKIVKTNAKQGRSVKVVSNGEEEGSIGDIEL
jgi:hypothetical protein